MAASQNGFVHSFGRGIGRVTLLQSLGRDMASFSLIGPGQESRFRTDASAMMPPIHQVAECRPRTTNGCNSSPPISVLLFPRWLYPRSNLPPRAVASAVRRSRNGEGGDPWRIPSI